MYDTGIIELRKITDNQWKAKYQGNYGVYIIKITTDGKKTVDFYCSCPSDYSPCKHISIIKEAIAKKIAADEDEGKYGGLRLEDFIGNVSAEKLRKFIIAQAKYNTELSNAILLEFSANVGNIKGNKYSRLIQAALASVPHDEDDYYLEECLNIDVLDQWIDKARNYVRLKEYDEALLICKALIEEYSQWLYNIEENVSMIFPSEYQYVPFDIMNNMIEHIDKKELYNYCMTEMKKKKYEETDFYYDFQQLFENLAAFINPDAFIAMQDKLFAGVKDKSSHEAETILQRKINFYRRLGQKKKAWEIIKENMQIESFRLIVVKRKIEKQNFRTAKKLINDFINSKEKSLEEFFDSKWLVLLLDIAQKEKDILAIRMLSYKFIKKHFNKKRFQIYKATFSPAEWANEREKLFMLYSGTKGFNSSAAEFLVAENEIERLVNYIDKYLYMDELERYYKVFASDYPEKTLEMFKKVLVPYATNTGRSHYDHISFILKKMSQIKGGEKTVSDLVADFRICYKNRRAMMEVLSEF
ncbi:hypothetical protein R84B8_00848 [Treponema sp. R8-4-B8]